MYISYVFAVNGNLSVCLFNFSVSFFYVVYVVPPTLYNKASMPQFLYVTMCVCVLNICCVCTNGSRVRYKWALWSWWVSRWETCSCSLPLIFLSLPPSIFSSFCFSFCSSSLLSTYIYIYVLGRDLIFVHVCMLVFLLLLFYLTFLFSFYFLSIFFYFFSSFTLFHFIKFYIGLYFSPVHLLHSEKKTNHI